MNLIRKIFLLTKEIGVSDLVNYSRYQFELHSGWIKLRTPAGGKSPKREILLEAGATGITWQQNWRNIESCSKGGLLVKESELLLIGKYQPFYGLEQPLELTLPYTYLQHWTAYANEFNEQDIKLTWEPARFAWSLALARAYAATKDDSYPEIFWKKVEEFTTGNPVNVGPNWSSAQEVAIRMINWIIASSAFSGAPATTPERREYLSRSILQHLERLLPTLNYARAQHNNHLLSEALGLLIGGSFLGNSDSRAAGWIERGTREFEKAILDQIDDTGSYSQHSANYHRMMLHLALLYKACLRKAARTIPQSVKEKLALATRWLISQLEPTNGHLPNLGHNDGTLLLPFGCTEYRDYRPVAQAAAIAFLGKPCLPPGNWDELTEWLDLGYDPQNVIDLDSINSTAIHEVGTSLCHAALRCVKFKNRPAHADQLHVELWWKGNNLARDAGTYSYNAPPPWQNGLDSTRVHNTVTIDSRDQMQRVSRFLWLDRAYATWLKTDTPEAISAVLHNYNRSGISHQRTLTRTRNGFSILDELIPKTDDSTIHEFCLHWLLPDWRWQIEDSILTLQHDYDQVELFVEALSTRSGDRMSSQDFSIIRAGQTLAGQRQDELLGWESDTYGEKHPVLSFSVTYMCAGPIKITTEWNLNDEGI